jgi:hypothetical protein
MTKEQAIKKVAKCGHTLPVDPILTAHTKMTCTCGAELSMLGNSFKFFPSYLVCPSCGIVSAMPAGGMPNLQSFTKEELGVE